MVARVTGAEIVSSADLVQIAQAVLDAEQIASHRRAAAICMACLLYTSDAADERSSVDLGGRRIIKKKNNIEDSDTAIIEHKNSCTNNHINEQHLTDYNADGVT